MVPAQVLLIHPEGHFNDLAVPAGAVACMNAVDAPKLGRYAFEVDDDEIRAARVVAIDLHWSIAVPGFARLAAHVKHVNPDVKIVVGGITAGHYPVELLSAHPVDYVIRGDSEVAFARLVHGLLAGAAPTGIPNVFSRDAHSPPLQRMTEEEFDATDTITTNWFPTLESVVDHDAEAHSQCRVILMARGCPLRCSNSYGSFAETHGKGILIRSPKSLVEQVRLAESLGSKKIRFIASKIPPTPFTAQLQALAAAGPFRFESGIAIFLCRPPPAEQLAMLHEAFDCEVTISAVPPMEHVPAISPERLAGEEREWSLVAAATRTSDKLRLHMCAIDPKSVVRAREEVIAEEPPKLMVFHGSVWNLERPTDDHRRPVRELREIMEPLWTFPAARCLSPALATLLEGFGYIDERGMEPGKMPVPDDARREYWLTIARQWEAHCLPTLPGLAWTMMPARRSSGRLHTSWEGTFYGGAAGALESDAFTLTDDAPSDLAHTSTHRGHYLTASLVVPPGADLIVFCPRAPGSEQPDPAWFRALSPWGMAVLDLSSLGPSTSDRTFRIELTIRVMEVGAAVLSTEGDLLLRGRMDLGLFRVKRRGGDHQRAHGHGRREAPRPVLGG